MNLFRNKTTHRNDFPSFGHVNAQLSANDVDFYFLWSAVPVRPHVISRRHRSQKMSKKITKSVCAIGFDPQNRRIRPLLRNTKAAFHGKARQNHQRWYLLATSKTTAVVNCTEYGNKTLSTWPVPKIGVQPNQVNGQTAKRQFEKNSKRDRGKLPAMNVKTERLHFSTR